jgi:hypothetical protein
MKYLTKWLQINLNGILHSLWSSFEEIQHRKKSSKNLSNDDFKRDLWDPHHFWQLETVYAVTGELGKIYLGFLDLHNIMWVYKWQLVWQWSLNYVGKPHSRETYVKHGKCSNPSGRCVLLILFFGCEMWEYIMYRVNSTPHW